MSWRWRRTLRQGPFSINMSKSGIGWSINLGLFRYGVNPMGRKYISAGIPGTGLYYYKYLNSFGIKQPHAYQPPTAVGGPLPPLANPAPQQSSNQRILDQIKQGGRNAMP